MAMTMMLSHEILLEMMRVLPWDGYVMRVLPWESFTMGWICHEKNSHEKINPWDGWWESLDVVQLGVYRDWSEEDLKMILEQSWGVMRRLVLSWGWLVRIWDYQVKRDNEIIRWREMEDGYYCRMTVRGWGS